MATVAVVNDDPDAREVVARVVARDGHVTHRVASVDEATALVGGGSIQLAVLDLVGGAAAANRNLLAALRAGPAGAAVRLVLVGRSPGAGLLAWQGGADGFVVRPFHARDLCRAMDEALARPDAEREGHRQAEIQAITAT